jgi:hypothetical protein
LIGLFLCISIPSQKTQKSEEKKQFISISLNFYKNNLSLILFSVCFRHYIQNRNYRRKGTAKMTKLKIKVIKKNTLINFNPPTFSQKKQKQMAERQIMSNVSGWISEFQNRQRQESKQFNQLFAVSS